uniref:FMRFamide-activated amiloride-sensitive sodium channel n=1 Tax=Trichobilharzia regenti TaxID=157069 RepID=A0AA85IWN8_TRIRE|nr:unnamed protein product [Trichobilharzia regenti]
MAAGETSTIQGLTHISTSSNNCARLIWFTLWLAGVTGFLTNLSHVVAHYLSRPVLTSYHEDHEEFVWPDITFCNTMAPYNLNTQERRALWNEYVNRARNLSTMNHIPKELFLNIGGIITNEVIIQSLVRSSIPHWRFNVGNVNDMFLFIARQDRHQGIRLTVDMDVKLTSMPKPWKNYFYTQILQKYYNVLCHNFQSDLHSYLIINSSHYSHIIDVYITLPNHFPATAVIELTPGYNHRVQLEMVRHQRLREKRGCHNKNFSAMIYDADLVTKRRIYDTGGDLCHRLLSQYLYLQECHCYSPFLPYGYFPDLLNITDSIDHHHHRNNTNINGSIFQPVLCLNMSVFNDYQLVENLNCMSRVFKKYSNASLYLSLEKAQHCEFYAQSTNCDEVKYNHFGMVNNPIPDLWGSAHNEARTGLLVNIFHLLSNQIMSDDQNIYGNGHISSENMKEVSRNESAQQEILQQLRNNFALLTVERISPRGRLVLEEHEYPLGRLLSDIGGNMGLWIGISVIGLFESFELIGCIIYASINYFKSLTMRLFKSRCF